MRRLQRFLVALAIVLSGLALAPYIALPSERFSWEAYVGVYEPSSTIIYLPIVMNMSQ